MADEAKKPGEIEAKPSEMVSRQFKVLRPLSAIGLTFMLFLIPQIIAGIAFAVFSVSQGTSLEEIGEGQASVGENFGLYAFAELLTLLGLFIVVSLKKKKLSDYGLNLKGLKNIWMVIPAFFVYFAATVVVQAIAGLFLSEDVINAEQQLGFEDATANWELALAFIALVLVAPFVEELVFRGFLFKEIRQDWSFIPTALVTAALFGLAHLQLNVGLDTFVLALPLAFLVEKTRSLAAPIALHAAKNFVAFTLIFLVDLEALEAAVISIF